MTLPRTEPLQKLAYSVKELRAVLPLGRNRILEEIHAGRLRAIRSGRRLIVPRASVEEFLASLDGAQE